MDPRSSGDYGKSELHSCICTPSQPASRTCSTLNDEEDEENVMIYLKRFMIWVTFAIKLILFTSLWALMMYWFLMSGGYVNVNPPPIILQDEWNTYIEKMQLFKFLPINNTYDTVEFEIQLQGPFADSNVFFNCQFERLYYHKDKYNSTDVRRDDADDVEVDHRIYEDSYSAVTSTTTRRTMSFTHTTLVWGWTWVVRVHWFIFSFTRTYYTTSMLPTTRTNTMTWWTFTTITARLTRYNLSRHPMTTFTIQEPYNFVPWGNIRVYSYSFRNFRAVSGRLHGHRHYGNMTADSNVTVTYGFRYMLNMTNMGDFLNNSALDTVAFAIQITKGMGRTSTTTTAAPLVVIKPADGIKYGFIIVGLLLVLLFLQVSDQQSNQIE
ncbi:uncharacterized protein LOC126378734 [Pectinophora gossypiella]|uniref:uncharacterized protein LOC126378734 n=1 Tax=Pectinophora gossypiella TaxID=13191 RepID=UPI00214EDAB0|nr:uncharacterized protein LOC126378734 [Pectinophora gossypiella]